MPPPTGAVKDGRVLLPPLSLGSPLYDRYARLLLAVDDARRAQHAAMITGDVEQQYTADHTYVEAMTDLVALKNREAADLLLRLRFVRDTHPGALEALLGSRLQDELEHVEAAVVALEHRADETEAAVAIIEQGGVA